MLGKCLSPVGEGSGLGFGDITQGFQYLPVRAKRVFVETEPDVQAVFFDTITLAGCKIASAGTFAAQSPALLVDGDLKFFLCVRRLT